MTTLRRLQTFRWVITAAIAALACHLAVQYATPVDRALPLLAVAATILAALAYPEIMLAVPLLIVAEIAFPDETVRLLALGAVMAAATAIAVAYRDEEGEAVRAVHAIATAWIATVLLRWIPLSEVRLGRELVLLLFAAAIVIVLGRTPLAIAVAVVTVLLTPAVPLRTLALPAAVLVVCAFARMFGMTRVALAWPSAIVVAFVMLFFAWSGVVARAFPFFLRVVESRGERVAVSQALPANASLVLDVPESARSLIVSGANVAALKRGALLGRIDPGGVPVRVGDAADWGYMRRDFFFGSHNPLPRDPAGTLRGYGYAAWVDGSGRMPLPRGARTIRVTADRSLPAGASLQVESFELAP